MGTAYSLRLTAFSFAFAAIMSATQIVQGQTQKTELEFKPYKDIAEQAAESGMPLLIFGMTDT